MLIPELDREAVAQANRAEHEALAGTVRWLDPGEAPRLEELRQGLLAGMAGAGAPLFNGTKPFHRAISPGCRLCGEGLWSCLFVNNLCNAGCFFCPARQAVRDEPGTSTLTFTSPGDYAAYLEEFGFAGASVSGGEPLLSLDRTVSFIARVRERFGKNIHLWLYTNGTLADEAKLRALSRAGLDEIRFNITATGYDLKAARMAAGLIPHVTVEIPAIPEDFGIMKDKLREMADSGISFLNLHQIRCTKHNAPRLAEKGYTFLHGPQIGILESELTALRLLGHAVEHDIQLGVNYCSLIYRHRYQARSSRRRLAPLMKKPFEDVTDAGMIRTVRIDAEPAGIERMAADLTAAGCDPDRWSADRGRIFVAGDLLRLIRDLPGAVSLSYAIVSLRPGVTYTNPFREIRLASGKKVTIERATTFGDLALSGPETGLFMDSFLEGGPAADMDAVYRKALDLDQSDAHAGKWQRIVQAEALRSGLLEYY